MKYNEQYGVDTICVNHDEKLTASERIQKAHPTMICQTACHVERLVVHENLTGLTPELKSLSTKIRGIDGKSEQNCNLRFLRPTLIPLQN